MAILSSRLLSPVDIIVDSREAAANKDIVEGLKKRGVQVAIAELSAGDYYLTAAAGRRPVLVERKTVVDFANSIRDGRIWDQAERLKEAGREGDAEPLLLLEGWLGLLERRTKWNITAVLRVLDELVLEWRIPVMPVHNKNATVSWLAAKAKSLGKTREKNVVRLRVDKKPLQLNDRILYVTEGLAGPVIARRLLQHFGTLRAIANASIRELMSVEGVGEKRAKEIYALFNTKWTSS
ncbi:MAG: hypothetical protein DSY37_03980 [Hyperthermus sp.]|nr:MAG: hypothetical protein DSY37_03980 [Hyperthermus sp.]